MELVVLGLQKLKIDFFAHSALICHESDMRRKTEAFSVLNDGDAYSREMRRLFYQSELNRPKLQS